MQLLLTTPDDPLCALTAKTLRDKGARIVAPPPADDPDARRQALEGCDALFHRVDADARLPDAVLQGRAWIEAARKARVRRLLLSLPASVLGPGDGQRPLTEGDDALPGDPGWGDGARWHLEAEWLAATDARAQTFTLLTPTLFGPPEAGLGSSALLQALITPTRRPLPLVSLNLADLRDVAAAHAEALHRARPGQRYLLGGAQIDTAALSAIAREVHPYAASPIPIPPGPLRRAALRLWGLDDAAASPLTHDKARAELGYTPRHHRVTLLDALAPSARPSQAGHLPHIRGGGRRHPLGWLL